MSDTVIKVENLSKVYRIGRRKSHDTLRDWLSDILFSRFRRLTGKSLLDEKAEDTIWALKDVSFEVKRGEILGIIGKNGSGKSTLLKILSRITEPTKGRAELHGRVSSLLEVGTGFHPELTGRENIFLNGAILGMKRAEIKSNFDEIVAFAEIDRFIDTPVKRYSSGMFVRLAFAVAAHLQPEILLVDEVLAVGDADFQKKCLGKMDSITKKGRTVLFVSHNLRSISTLCPNAILLRDGEIKLIGISSDVISHYLGSHIDYLPRTVNTSFNNRPNIPQDSDLEITEVSLIGPGEQAINAIESSIEMLLSFRVRNHVKNLLFGWTIMSSSGTPLLNFRSVNNIGLIEELESGDYSVRCRVNENPLNPGTYSINIAARTDMKQLDYCPDAIYFRIIEEKSDDVFEFKDRFGVFHLQAEWTFPEKLV